MTEVKMLQLTYSISILLVALVQSLVPRFSGRDSFLGVRFSEKNMEKPEIKEEIRGFTIKTLGLGLILALLTYYILGIYSENYVLQISFFLLATLALFIPLVQSNKRLKRLKTDWMDPGPKRKVTVATEVSGRKTGFASTGLWIYLPSIFIIILTTGYILNNYQNLPDIIPIHFDFQGQADGFANKSLITALIPSISSITLFITIFLSNLAYLAAKQRLNPQDPQGSLDNYLQARRIWTYFFGITTLIMVAFTQVYLSMTMLAGIGMGSLAIWLILGFSLLIIVVSILLGLKVGTAGEKLSKKGVSSFDSDDDSWKLGGLFYYNKKDPALFVYKRVGIGVTINLAKPLGKAMVVGLILIVLLPMLLLVFIG